MSRFDKGFFGAAAVFIGALAIAANTQGQTPVQAPQQVQALDAELRAEREKVSALATAAAGMRQQIEQMRREWTPACIAAIEKANPTTTVDPKTMGLTDRDPRSVK